MMQALHVKTATKPKLDSKAFHQALVKQSESLTAKVKTPAEIAKTLSFNRFLEANSDCV